MSETLQRHLKKVQAKSSIEEISQATLGITSLQRVLNYILEQEGDANQECELCDNGCIKSGLYYATRIIAEYIDLQLMEVAACVPPPTLWPEVQA